MRLIGLATVAAIATVFIGCGEESTDTTTVAPEPTTTVAPETTTTEEPTTTSTTTSTTTTTTTTTISLPEGATAMTENGPIRGKVVKKNTGILKQQPIRQAVEKYLGLPYAKAPVGELRFKAPERYVESWEDSAEFDKEQTQCIQSSGKGSEDCLYLNVFRPTHAAAGAKLPVLFWIYGGGFVNGKSADYDGTVLAAEHDSVVVTVNYRLGHLGFFGSEASFAQEGTTGNWGVLDQQAALEWVQRNIDAFGGDKDRVMIFGESAGAFSVMWHIAAPGSKGLFHSAVLESGTSHVTPFFQPAEDAYKYYDWVATELVGCEDASDMECLRNAEVSKLMLPDKIRFDAARAPTWASPIFPMMPVGPIIDGVSLPDVPVEVVKAGNHNDVPVIAGVNRNEGSAFVLALKMLVPGVPFFPTEKSVKDTVFYMLQDEDATNEVLELYPQEQFSLKYGEENAPFERGSELIRDAIFHCPNRQLAEALHKQESDVWVYSFDVDPLFIDMINDLNTDELFEFGNLTASQMGSFHSAEIPFVFKKFSDLPVSVPPQLYDLYMSTLSRKKGDDFHVLSDQMSCMWANLAASGHPVKGDAVCPTEPELIDWPTFKESSAHSLGQFMHLGLENEVRPLRESNHYPDSEFPNKDVCEFWDTHPIAFHNLRADLTGDSSLKSLLI